MTLPKVVSDRLILAPSLSRAPVAPVLLARSLPARSTRLMILKYQLSEDHVDNFPTPCCYLILATFSVSRLVISSWRFCVRNNVNTACDLEDVSFILVAATVLAYKLVSHRMMIVSKTCLVTIIHEIIDIIKRFDCCT